MSKPQTRHSSFWKWTIALSFGCLIVFATDIIPAFGLLEIVGVLITIAVCLLSFVLIFTDVRTALVGITAAAVCFSISYNHWPATARFKLSEQRLNELLSAYEADNNVEVPTWCGSYYVRKIERRGQWTTCFWTDLGWGGYTGLIYTPDGRRMQYVNDHKQFHLNSNWRIVSED